MPLLPADCKKALSTPSRDEYASPLMSGPPPHYLFLVQHLLLEFLYELALLVDLIVLWEETEKDGRTGS